MKLVRIIAENPADAGDLISFLEQHGFTVEVAGKSDPRNEEPDLEFDLSVLPLEAALSIARELSEDVDVFFAPGIFPEPEPVPPPAEAPVANEASLYEVPKPPKRPVPSIALARLRDSGIAVAKEIFFTIRECMALIVAELVNGIEQSRDWLGRTRILLVRKRALVEARATRARVQVEHRLRLERSGPNAWILSAIAGAALMVVLLSMMLWKQQEIASKHPAVPDSLSATKDAASQTSHTTDTASVTPAAHTMRRHSLTAADIDTEVIIHHFDHPRPTVVTTMDSGIKHYSDMN